MPQDLESPLEKKRGRPVGSMIRLGSFYDQSVKAESPGGAPVKAEGPGGAPVKAEILTTASTGTPLKAESPEVAPLEAKSPEVVPLRLEADFVFETGEVPMLGGCMVLVFFKTRHKN